VFWNRDGRFADLIGESIQLRGPTIATMSEERETPDVVPEGELLQLARGLNALLGHLNELANDNPTDDLVERLKQHLGVDPKGLAVITHKFPGYQLVDVQVALEMWATGGPDRGFDLVGVSGHQRRFNPLSELISQGRFAGVGLGAVDYADIADSPNSTCRCVQFGLFLLADGDARIAVLLRGEDPHGPMDSAMLELLGPDDDFVGSTLAELRQLALDHSVLRGQVLTLGPGEGNQYGRLRFLQRPELERSHLVLPDSVLHQIEQHVVGIADHRERLQAAGQHLKRGILLYGPPGTGKTHTIRYLLSQLKTMTAFVLSGQSLGLIGMACGLARILQPSMVILEDVDLIAGDRSFGPMGANPLLFEVLNQIDGLGDDVDVTFVLTTNRVDILERALAERPGRVDAAVEIGPPDEEGRRRLFRLYGERLGIRELGDQALQGAVAATEGRTATYLREVVRRAALLSAEAEPDGQLQVGGDVLERAAEMLLEDRAALTRSLLGEPLEPDAEPPVVGGFGPNMGGVMMARGFIGRRSQGAAPFAPDE
jgi:cell division protease FtsH